MADEYFVDLGDCRVRVVSSCSWYNNESWKNKLQECNYSPNPYDNK